MLHCGVCLLAFYLVKMTYLLSYPPQAVRQTVRIVGMDHPQGLLRTGDRATVTFEFIRRPEFIKEGMKLLFREGKTKVSDVSSIFSSVLNGNGRDLVLSLDYYELVLGLYLIDVACIIAWFGFLLIMLYCSSPFQ
jgi:hypothetical protein